MTAEKAARRRSFLVPKEEREERLIMGFSYFSLVADCSITNKVPYHV
jgi:hypothetical protein